MKEISNLLSKYEKEKEIKLSFQYLSDEMTLLINSLIVKILIKSDQVYLIDTAMAIIKEILINSIKANAKRIYFKESNLDISNPKDYSKGMSKFMRVVMSKSKQTKEFLEDRHYKIILKIKNNNDNLKIIIINNSTLLPVEIERINARLHKAEGFDKFADAYDLFFDPTEGAGLGLILVIFLLKKAGISSDNFKIVQSEKFYTTTLTIPRHTNKIEMESTIKDNILKDIESLPTFPEHIVELKKLCSSSNSTINLIASKIKNDPSLTADILKIANSAGFNIGKKIDTVEKAIILIGLNNIDLILSVAISRKLIHDRYKKFEQIWNHCNRIAFYARLIAEKMGQTSIIDSVFISGLLHDIGKIVLLSADVDMVNRISTMLDDTNIRSSALLEEISIGISHATIGALIAEKWNFPEYLVQVIGHHHSPSNCDPEYINIVSIIYLANMLQGIESGKYQYTFLELDILERFSIYSRDDLDRYSAELNEKYDTHNSLIN